MSTHPDLDPRLRNEADLIQRVVGYYRPKLAGLIDRLNAGPDALTDIQCLRLCVEAVDVMLSSQGELAQALRGMAAAVEPSSPTSGDSEPTSHPNLAPSRDR